MVRSSDACSTVGFKGQYNLAITGTGERRWPAKGRREPGPRRRLVQAVMGIPRNLTAVLLRQREDQAATGLVDSDCFVQLDPRPLADGDSSDP